MGTNWPDITILYYNIFLSIKSAVAYDNTLARPNSINSIVSVYSLFLQNAMSLSTHIQ